MLIRLRVCLLSADAGAALRALAARINTHVIRDGLTLESALKKSPQPPARDSALLLSLSYGVLRWHHRVQWQVAELLSRPLKTRDAELAALLRLGLFQLQWLRIPAHAAVSATVAAAQHVGAGRAKGLVNAVLRRFIRERSELDRRMADASGALASHPGWLLDAIKSAWPENWQEVVAANNRTPPMWLRVNQRRIARTDYLTMLAASDIATEPACPTDSAIQLTEPQAMSTLPGFDDGLVSIQDAAAQLAPGYLQLEPGLRVLDACAAPGGKSAHILEFCPELAELVVLDRDAERLATVREAFARLNHRGTVVQGDAAEPLAWWDGRSFDRILLDAPCSALGVIRRHPDIKVLRRPEDVERISAVQRRLLLALWPLLAPGGIMLYVTCTIVKQENENQVSGFVNEISDAELVGPGAGAGRQILPGEANMDGFYYACLKKKE
ncbi:MAG: 16S rRNA (cytosine(967)-C(5))-methyltransferase RsmB [Gammaproteobacteria bacterium]|nr:16S rRNA (cytosine(967)-C(5))-methyltransferase RsmB [Gammaproteobacteria bacterium]